MKCQKFLYLNQQQIEINNCYFTTKGGLIAWVKLDPVVVKEVHRRAIKASSNNFRTAHFIPSIARERKASADKILLDYKKLNKDFKYIIRNSTKDIQILVKRISELSHTPYRVIPIESLGALTPLKTRNKPVKNTEEVESIEDGYETITKDIRENYISKEEIYNNITSFLNGFNVENERS